MGIRDSAYEEKPTQHGGMEKAAAWLAKAAVAAMRRLLVLNILLVADWL